MTEHATPQALIDSSIREAADAGIMMQTADDAEYSGRHVEIGGARLLNFGSCSYLGLEQRPELKEGAIRAIHRYGTQFSISRAYLQSPLYEKLEHALEVMTGGHALIAPSTTLSHIAALPVLVQPGDAVMIDRWAHASVHGATALLGSKEIVPVRHNDLEHLDQEAARLTKTHRHVWYLIDGLYSMTGEFAPLAQIAALLEKYPGLHLYVDDAHSTSWSGRNGRGWALEHLPDRSRVVVALSLNKAFSAAGAALVFPTAEVRSRVRRCGGPMLFSGPIQPPMLGAALASAELHLRADFASVQQSLIDRIDLMLSLARDLGVRLVAEDRSPIFFVRCGPVEVLYPLAHALRAQGMYACPSGFPAVPKDQSGIRFTVSLHNTGADIRRFMEILSLEMKRLGL
jgi:7-keto-8-aminopelargonate synthetase-like enzyme